MEYVESTGNILAFTDLNCKFKHITYFMCCASYSLMRKTWKTGVLKKPYSTHDIQGSNFYVPQNTVEKEFNCPTDSLDDDASENGNISTPNSSSSSQAVLSPSRHIHVVHTI